ncbi:unnamed protein product [Kuraishia capsulata CBS 1993]|uniref:Uncharacterized protein n=1 Tax=Kuraishia capsulata CBS 1993 TaxID=1382522 RepID=W6MJK5_9ASCO|nr:unnamed protein product [Kuraishia capsulata CBS 1993]
MSSGNESDGNKPPVVPSRPVIGLRTAF